MSMKKMMIAVAAASLVLAGCASHKTKPVAQPTVAPAAPAQAQNEPTAPAADTAAADKAAELKAQEDAAAAAAAKAKEELAQRTVHFAFDSADLQQNDLDLLKAHAKYLAAHNDAKVQVEGNCDERGTAEYNLALGERRAKSVAAFLENEGVHAKQLKTVSYGKEKPVDPAHSEEAWAKNRRVDLDYKAGQP